MLSVASVGVYGLLAFVASIVLNLVYQFVFAKLNKNEPPLVFHWIPFLGNTISYGMDPYKFFFACREKVCLPPFCRIIPD